MFSQILVYCIFPGKEFQYKFLLRSKLNPELSMTKLEDENYCSCVFFINGKENNQSLLPLTFLIDSVIFTEISLSLGISSEASLVQIEE